MEKLFRALILHKKTVLIVFGICMALSIWMAQGVRVNFNFADYLPDASPSTIAMDVMGKQFDGGVPNARFMVEDVTIPEALELKSILKNISGITGVLFLDDAVNIGMPLGMHDPDTVSSYYQDGAALYSVTVAKEGQSETLAKARKAIEDYGKTVNMTGNAINNAEVMRTTSTQVRQTMMMAIPLCFFLLLLTTSSFFEPVLFMAAIGAAILLNMGTNLLFGEISFVTSAAGSILQLAVSMDYSIFLLHRFTDMRAQGLPVGEAMVKALCAAFTSVTASGLTTVIGFASLAFMRFKIGPDMGFVMAKAILLSMITVLVLLPVLAILFHKAIDKTRHRPFTPNFRRTSSFVLKMRVPFTLLFLLIAVPAFLAQQSNSFAYGASRIISHDSPAYAEREKVEAVFEKENQLVLLVPRGDFANEAALSQALRRIPEVKSVISYVDKVGPQVPPEYLESSTRATLLSEQYSRMILFVRTEPEGERAFRVVDQVHAAAEAYYAGTYHLAGETVTAYDMRNVVTADMQVVNLVAVVAVFLVLLLTMRSLVLPVILVFVIEAAIWLNFSFPYFAGDQLFYIAYLIISAIQLGATVDYAILLANRYVEERQTKNKRDAMQQTMEHTTLSILTSAIILAIGGAALGLISTNSMLAQLGLLVGRGALLSAAFVLLVLPSLLYPLDALISKTTKRPFLKS